MKRNLKESILQLRSEGKSYNEIVAILGCSKGTVAYWLGENQKNKYKESSKKSRAEKQKKMFLLKSNPCTDCKKEYHPVVMHWDHLDSATKIDNISRLIMNSSWAKVLEEVKKCELVCANCHQMRTLRRLIATNNVSDESKRLYLLITKQT